MTLLGDGERLTGAYALGPGAGEWLQQPPSPFARVPLEVLRDTIQRFPTFTLGALPRSRVSGRDAARCCVVEVVAAR
jgi:hypothetical protein